jgi:hypothetical protein
MNSHDTPPAADNVVAAGGPQVHELADLHPAP